MMIQVADWSSFDQVLPIALKYGVGLEYQEFTNPENLDHPDSLINKIKGGPPELALLSMHGPFFDLVPASRDARVRQVAGERFQQAIEIAHTIGARHLILHSGYFLKTDPREMWVENACNFWREFLRDYGEAGFIHVENVYEDDFNALREVIDRVNEAAGKEVLTICLDIGHVNANSSKSLAEWISGLGDRIRYVHLHNNGGILDDHWKLEKGKIEVAKVLDQLKRDASQAQWTVETTVADIEPSLLWLQDRGYL